MIVYCQKLDSFGYILLQTV